MASRAMTRLIAVCTLGLAALLILPGCGGNKPPSGKAGDKKEGDNANAKGGSPSDARAPSKVDLDSGVGKDAVVFLKALGESTAKAELLSGGFVKAIGLPAELPGDKARGFSAAAAESWMKRIGGATFGLPAGFAGPGAAVLWGGFQGPGRKGDYFLRMVNEGGAWKVDYFALTSAASQPTSGPAQGPDGEYQRFTARAIGGLLCDRDAMPKDERAMALAAGLTPALRARLADPFGSDKDQGFDYNRGKLILEAERLGGGAESYSTSPQSAATDFRLDVMKAGGAKTAYLLKLVKGPAPGQWLVESITPQ
jgi:hypothetical protein